VSWWFYVKHFGRSVFYIGTSVVQPVILASLGFFMFRAGVNEVSLLYVAIGVGFMGVWSTTLYGSADAIQWSRFQGTLELIVCAPAPLVATMLGFTLASATIGFYSVAATLGWGVLLFHVPLHAAHPFLCALALPSAVIALGAFGLLLASSLILYRSANAVANLLEYPVWLVSGLLVPVSLLPGWAGRVGDVLAPTWGVRAVRHAVLGGDVISPMMVAIGLACVYVVAAHLLLRRFERVARGRATLSLS
jgi:ABC-2 type transport system permease protein